MELETLGESWLKWLVAFSATKEVVGWQEALATYLASSNFSRMQGSMNALTNGVAAMIGKEASQRILTPQIQRLAPKEIAKFTREHLAVGVRQGYGMANQAAFNTYSKILKGNGVLKTPLLTPMDANRLKDAVAGSIKLQLEGDFEQASRSMASSFEQIIRTAPRNTLLATGEKLEQGGIELRSRRVVTSPDACPYCKSLSGVSFPVTDARTKAQFHDNCHCVHELVVERW